VIRAFKDGNNETFKKVLGGYLLDLQGDFEFEEFVQVLDFLDEANSD